MLNPQLETFICTADAGSFTREAEALYVSVPAIIKHINALEGKLHLKLFQRGHRGLVLTPAGESFYADAKYMIQYAKDSVRRAEQAAGNPESMIRIGTSPVTPAYILMELWPKIHDLCPQLNFRLIPFENTPENAREILRNLGQNIDMVAGIFDDSLLDYRRCAGLELTREPVCCAVSLQSPLAAKEKLQIRDLYGQRLMLLGRGRMRAIDALREDLEQNHPQIQIVDFDFYDTEIFNRCHHENAALVAVACWKNVHPLLKIIPVEWGYSLPFGLLYAAEPSPLASECVEAIRGINQKV